jgi:hypothetical protein|tara:strand:- start:238 stop:471 length:234 start_codon:yes stop_codon:yes gene_type:complete
MKFVLILYLCSTLSGQCPSQQISGYVFENHYDCVYSGYGLAQQTYKNLNDYEEYSRQNVEKNRIVIKFECKELGSVT